MTPVQYSGVNDANGNMIFEGDILSVKNRDPYSTSGNSLVVVEFCGGCFGHVSEQGKFEPFYDSIAGANTDTEVEIVGNIYENSNLVPNYVKT